jgi:hypothetical protein
MLDTAKAYGVSAFGPLRLRIIDDGASDWQPFAALLRLPGAGGLKCPSATDQPCELIGSDLFLIDSLSDDHTFGHAVKIPEGLWTEYTLSPFSGRAALHEAPRRPFGHQPADVPTQTWALTALGAPLGRAVVFLTSAAARAG